MRRNAALGIAAALAAAFAWSRASAAELSAAQPDAPVSPSDPEYPGALADPHAVLSSVDWLDGSASPFPLPSDRASIERGLTRMIRASEHSAVDVAIGRDYQTAFGGAQFFNLTDHPANTGEFPGVKLKADYCIAAGFPNGECKSTAAGAYQIKRDTWNRVRRAGRYGGEWREYLPDFSPFSQDDAAIRLMLESGALQAALAGSLDLAIQKASNVWASLPGAPYGQPTRSMDFALAKFNEGAYG